MKRGADISEYQGQLDYEQLALSVDFVYIRASIGVLPDKYIDRNIQETDRLGIKRGFYHAYDWGIPLAPQIDKHYRLLEGVREDYNRAIDFEKYRGIQSPKAILAGWEEAFLEIILYSNIDFIKRYLQDPTLTRIKLWLANWRAIFPAVPLPWPPIPYMWQYAVVPGASYGCKPNPKNVPKIDLDVMLEI